MLPKSIKGRYELLGFVSNFLQRGSITLNILLEIVRNRWNRKSYNFIQGETNLKW